MSGPKVVRIVTREEILDICHGLVSRVDAALDDWEKVARRNDVFDEEALASAKERRRALATLIAADRFDALQKEAPAEEAFLLADLERRLEKAASLQAQAQSRERRTREAGASLLRSLETSGIPMDPELQSGLRTGDPDAVSAALSLLSDVANRPEAASDDLAKSLREDDGRRTFADWMSARPESEDDPAVTKIAIRLATIARSDGDADVSGMKSRLRGVEGASLARRAILLDGLEIESGRALDAARRKEALLREARMLIAESRTAGLEIEEDLEILRGLENDVLEDWTSSKREVLAARRDAVAAHARRTAVLEALGELGYDVVEGMETAVADGGRIVLRSASRPDYGVEMLSAGSTGRMQMRPVAFGTETHGPDPARDRDAETIWCREVGTLRETLADRGDVFRIERALPVGAVALKRMDIGVGDREAERFAPTLHERSRPR